MSFSPSFLDDLRARVGLADVVGTSVKLIKRGREYSGLCPVPFGKIAVLYGERAEGFLSLLWLRGAR